MGDVERALAFVARRAGRSELPAAEWAHTLSLGLGWMSPSQAAAFVARAKEAGTLWDEEGRLRLTVEPAAFPAPLGFKPDPEARPEGRGDPFAGWVQQVATKRGVELPQVMRDVALRQEALGGHLTALAAILWLAAEAGLDVRREAAAFRP